MNVLKREKQIAVISGLTEGLSIRSVERLTRVHRDTICRLVVRIGQHCETIMDETMRGLTLSAVQADEIWGFVGKKAKHVRPDDPYEFGDAYTFVALDEDTKLVPWFTVGKRDEMTTHEFIANLAMRVKGRVQITTDGWSAYRTAIPEYFGSRADYEQIIKQYGENPDEHRYSPPKVTHIENRWVQGSPHVDHITTSHVERQNLTMRMHLRRLTRLTNAFSKKLVNLRAAIAAHFVWYNFVRVHRTLRTTPAMAAGLASTFWTIGDMIP